MSEPLPLSSINSNYIFYPINYVSNKQWKRTHVPMAYELDPEELKGQRTRFMLSVDDTINLRANENALLLRNISINFVKQIPNIDNVVYIGNRQDENQTNKDIEFIPYDHLNQDCNLIVAVGDYKSTSERETFNDFYVLSNFDIDSVIKSFNGNIVNVYRVNWDGETGSTEQYTLPDILLRPGQSLWFIAYYTFQQFEGIVLDNKYVSNGVIRLNINMFFDQIEIDPKTVQGYPFSTNSVLWDWPGKDEAINGNP